MSEPTESIVAKDLPIAAMRNAYGGRKRLHLPRFLDPEFASRLYHHLVQREDWSRIFNTEDCVRELPESGYQAMTAGDKAKLDQAIEARASETFQYRYSTIRLDRESSKSPLGQLVASLASDTVLKMVREVTGFQDISTVDAQATRYSPGDFLTAHDDKIAGMNRRAAYVINLTPKWRIEWGGLLVFHGSDGHVDEALSPCWNALNIFSVPQVHSVSWVNATAGAPRYAVTGWFHGAG